MKTTILILLLSITSAFADLGTTIYTATTGTGKTTSPGCVYVNFTLQAFSGTIGNATMSSLTFNLPIVSGYQSGSGQRLNAIPYSVTSGTLIITEVK